MRAKAWMAARPRLGGWGPHGAGGHGAGATGMKGKGPEGRGGHETGARGSEGEEGGVSSALAMADGSQASAPASGPAPLSRVWAPPLGPCPTPRMPSAHASASAAPADGALALIGNTPLVRARSLDTGPCELFLKLGRTATPAAPSKTAIALSMIQDAERSGRLAPGGVIVEATAGNTGLGLALVGRLRGYRVVLVVPDKMARREDHPSAGARGRGCLGALRCARRSPRPLPEPRRGHRQGRRRGPSTPTSSPTPPTPPP